jgi:hypothetical protein
MFQKVLLLVAVVAFIWFGFRFLTRLAEMKRRAGAGPRPDPRIQRGMGAMPADAGAVQDLVSCPRCNTWRPATNCGRADCPF